MTKGEAILLVVTVWAVSFAAGVGFWMADALKHALER